MRFIAFMVLLLLQSRLDLRKMGAGYNHSHWTVLRFISVGCLLVAGNSCKMNTTTATAANILAHLKSVAGLGCLLRFCTVRRREFPRNLPLAWVLRLVGAFVKSQLVLLSTASFIEYTACGSWALVILPDCLTSGKDSSAHHALRVWASAG